MLLLHGGLPAGTLGPVVHHVLRAGPEADGDTGRVGSAQSGGLNNLGANHRHASHVSLELHQQTVVGHAAVNLDLG